MSDETPPPSPAPDKEAPRELANTTMLASVNVYALTFGVFGTVILTKVASYLTPYKLYFSFSSFLYDDRAAFKWEGLAIKLIIPCIIGFCLFYLPYRWMIWTRGSRVNYRLIFRYLIKQARLTAITVGFFSSLLMAWPFIVYWDILQRPDLIAFRLPFLCVYFLYFVSYAYFAGLGVSIAQNLLKDRLPMTVSADSTKRVAWLETVRLTALGIVTSGLATYLASTLSLPK